MNYTKLSQNPKYGRPSAAKLRQRMEGWAAHRRSWELLRLIQSEIELLGLTSPYNFRDPE